MGRFLKIGYHYAKIGFTIRKNRIWVGEQVKKWLKKSDNLCGWPLKSFGKIQKIANKSKTLGMKSMIKPIKMSTFNSQSQNQKVKWTDDVFH